MSTRDQIVEKALDLFSQQGYGGVSVRDIARAVGIRESSIYNHFDNKRAIFDTIVDVCFQKAESYFKEKSLPFDMRDDLSLYRGIGLEQLQQTIEQTFRYFFEDPWNLRFRRLLIISQYADGRCRDIYRRLYRDYCLQFQANLFQYLMEAGQLRREDPMAAAIEFYSPIYLLLHTCDTFEEARPAIRTHVELFARSYGATGGIPADFTEPGKDRHL